jgi:hypothetical protein
VLSNVIGIKEWFAPQISEHWPKKMPGRLIKKLVWFNRPGVASTFTPNEGMVHEWITSADVIKIRFCKLKGKTILLSTLINRKLFCSYVVIYESNSTFKKFVYS